MSSTTIMGSDEDDVMIGTRNADIIYAEGGGRDLVCAFRGNDAVLGLGDGGSRAYLGPGHDFFARGGKNWRVNGGPGSDFIDAGNGSTIRGGVGNDMLLANGRHNNCPGGAGHDYILDTGGHGHTFRGGPGNDFIVGRNTQLIHGGTGHDDLSGETGVLRGGGGNDIISGGDLTFVRGGPGDDACIGRACERHPGDAVSPGIPDLADELWTG